MSRKKDIAQLFNTFKACPVCDVSAVCSFETVVSHGEEQGFCTNCGAKLENRDEPVGENDIECSECGQDILRSDKFCGHCRHQNSEYQPEKLKYCLSCEAFLPGGWVHHQFCVSCGAELDEVDSINLSCGQCNRRINRIFQHCPYCGTESPKPPTPSED